MSDYEGYYERLTEYASLEGKDVEEWLKDLKQGDSPEITESEVQEMKQIHLEQQAEEKSEEFKADVEEDTLRYERGVTEIETSSGDVDLSEVSGVFRHPNGAVYVQGKDGKMLGTIE